MQKQIEKHGGISKRKFYRNVFTIEVLSEDPINKMVDLDEIHYQITDGEWSGMINHEKQETVDGKQMAELLQKQGSDPGFFRLDDAGQDAE